MNTMSKEAPERQEIEALLPWHAAGTLSRREADRVELALSSDHELSRRFDLVREELNETIHLNESLGAPSSRAMERLFAAIDAEPTVKRQASFDLAGRMAAFLSGFAPRTLAYAAGAAAIALVIQSAVLTTVMIKDQAGSGLELASYANGGSVAVVRFVPQATASDITKFLDAYKAVVVDGPKKGGLYSVRLSADGMPKAEVTKIVQRMQSESKIVEFIATKE
ncbi:MAG: hypothetical protein QOI12_4538 [Alphaproteobacteria bacterium]|jgi:anti-sigma-K factor RskA|nr:hypothetical protein [Alphaproteobacteria bacterium]